MGEFAALRAAIDLLHLPSDVQRLREEPLPSGVPLLLRVAAGEDKALVRATELTERPGEMIQEAAGFFIEQILFAPDTNSYRVLGTSSKATARELRGNMALLIRWLHPDLDQGEERSVFIGRVTAAWDDLKTQERRMDYDRAHPPQTKKKKPQNPPRQKTNGSRRSTKGAKSPAKQRTAINHPAYNKNRHHALETYLFNRPGPIKRILLILLGGMRQ